MSLFGTSGIRGVYGEKITPQLVHQVGNVIPSLGMGKIITSHDHRLTSPSLSLALQSGLLSGGCEVIDLGLCPTPVTAWNAKKENADSSAIITASHNPPHYNGIKLHDEKGAGWSKSDCQELEEKISQKPAYAGWDEVRKPKELEGVNNFINTIVDELGTDNNTKVVVDCNHGTAGVVSPELLERIGCEVTRLREEPNGTWSVPQEYENPKIGDWGRIAHLKSLIQKVRNEEADLGIVHDGDSDRVFIVTKKGPVIPDALMAVMAELRGQEAVVSVDASMIIEEHAKITRVPVGDVAISNELRGKKNAWGGEPSGTFIWPEFSLCPDGIRTAAMIAASWNTIKEELEQIPEYPMKRTRIECPNQKKNRVMEKVKKKAQGMGEVSTIDGIRVKTGKGWFLIRPSGTEPVIRIMAEAREKEELSKLLKTAKSLLEGSL